MKQRRQSVRKATYAEKLEAEFVPYAVVDNSTTSWSTSSRTSAKVVIDPPLVRSYGASRFIVWNLAIIFPFFSQILFVSTTGTENTYLFSFHSFHFFFQRQNKP
jgi:hypothetical protein